MSATQRNRFLGIVLAALAVMGVVLLSINIYGLFQTIRKPGLGFEGPGELRFVPDSVWSYEESMLRVDRLRDIKDKDAAVERAMQVVNTALVHPDWYRVDPVEYRQLVPVWENFFLYFLGKFSGLPQFERYHFADYRRSIERGIGMCGDAAMVLSSILDTLEVENRIISFDGHVVVEYKDVDGHWHLADPDFGVLVDASVQQLAVAKNAVKQDYLSAGYPEQEVNLVLKSFATDYSVFDDTYDFLSKRYVFEYASYVLKWLLPALLIAQWCLFQLFWKVRKVR